VSQITLTLLSRFAVLVTTRRLMRVVAHFDTEWMVHDRLHIVHLALCPGQYPLSVALREHDESHRRKFPVSPGAREDIGEVTENRSFRRVKLTD
jgi:hypothetical protein